MKQAFQFQTQAYCTDVRMGIPGSLFTPDSDHPVIFNCFGYTLCYKSADKGYVEIKGESFVFVFLNCSI
jgi:hypothetical protein